MALQARIAELRAENTVLAAQARALKNDPVAIEAVARQLLGLAKAGEVVVRIQVQDSKP